MTKQNPKNPFSTDEDEIKRSVPMPVSKAKVEAAYSHPDENGFHVVKVRVYGEDAPHDAPVIPPSIGSAWIPRENTDVAVMFGQSDKPWVIGPWYAGDRVEEGEIDIPDYEPGELVLGNHTGAHIRIDNDGNVHINSSDSGDVYIDGTKQ